jgi:polynucleotide 5'-hydroxyl-kinase GRC3/NOL9
LHHNLAEIDQQADKEVPATTAGWAEVISEITSNPGVVMVIGEADAGKTSFCVQLANAAVRAGIPTAIVDADVGQSEIGAPGTIGMGLVSGPVEIMSEVKPKRLYFIGTTSPVRHLLECCVGARRMTDAAREQGAKLIILDTTGLVDGYLGRKLKTCKVDLVRPDYILAVQKRKEVEHLLAPFAGMESVKIERVPASELARRKPQEFRTARRRANFNRHFNDAPGHMIRLDDISTWHTWLGSGRRMKWQYMKFMEDALRCRILHAEVTGRGIFAVAERKCERSGLREIEEQFKTRNITIIAGEALNNLLVGLADSRGNTINVGLIQAIDFQQRLMFVLSPIKTITPVKIVQFGSIHLTKEGRELGSLGPGDI